jgi:3-hydroxyisobutyrate dehydrogenase-like beta-hydroxyacid dehydrogenase
MRKWSPNNLTEEIVTRVGVVGIGNMGEGMALNILAKGFPLVVRDVRPEPVNGLIERGATAASSNEELGRQSDVVMVAVFSQAQVYETLRPHGEDAGVIAGMAPGGTICVNSTISPTALRELAEEGSDRNVTVIDVAMSGGGDVAARAGELTFMAGGEREAFERVLPVLQTMATTIHHVGPLGAGVTSKIINNLLAIQNVSTVREALALSRALGFDESDILGIVESAVGASWVSNHWNAIRVQEQGHTLGQGGIAAMAGKDLELALELGRETNTPMPLLEFVVDSIVPDLHRRGMTGDRAPVD